MATNTPEFDAFIQSIADSRMHDRLHTYAEVLIMLDQARLHAPSLDVKFQVCKTITESSSIDGIVELSNYTDKGGTTYPTLTVEDCSYDKETMQGWVRVRTYSSIWKLSSPMTIPLNLGVCYDD